MDEPVLSPPAPPSLEKSPPDTVAGTVLMALAAFSPPSQVAREVGAQWGGQALGGISSQGGMELSVFAFTSTAAALKCSRAVLGAAGGKNSAIGLHLGEISLETVAAGGKPNTDREGVRIATGLSQQADEGSALLSQTFYEIARSEGEVPANYLGPKQIRLVPRTVPVFKLNLGDERANQKNVVSKQMDLILMEERQRNQEMLDRRRKQVRVLGAMFLVIVLGGFGIMLLKLLSHGQMGSVIGMVEAGVSGDAGKVAAIAGNAAPPETSATIGSAEEGFTQLLTGETMSPDSAKAAYCQSLYVLAQSTVLLELPSSRIAKALEGTTRSDAERKIISEHFLAQLSKADDVGILDDTGVKRLGLGQPPEGYQVIQLLPGGRYPEFEQFPANFVLRRASSGSSSSAPPVEAVELLEKLKAAGLTR